MIGHHNETPNCNCNSVSEPDESLNSAEIEFVLELISQPSVRMLPPMHSAHVTRLCQCSLTARKNQAISLIGEPAPAGHSPLSEVAVLSTHNIVLWLNCGLECLVAHPTYPEHNETLQKGSIFNTSENAYD